MELAFLSAVEQARLVRSGEVSSTELVQLSLERIDAARPHAERVRHRLRRRGARRRGQHRLDARRRAVPRRSDRRQGPHSDRRHPHDLLVAGLRRVRPRLRHGRRPAHPRRRLRRSSARRTRRSSAPSRSPSPTSTARRATPGTRSSHREARAVVPRPPSPPGSSRSRTPRDGGGSIRIPASCCGLFGLKPSRGRVSSAPFGSLEGLSTAGPMARTVEDAAAFLDVLAGYEPGDPWWAPPPERPFAVTTREPPGRLRVAVTTTPPIDTPVDPECVRAATVAAELLAELGHDVREETPPWREPSLFDLFITVWQVGPALHPVDERAADTAESRSRRVGSGDLGRRLRAGGRPAPGARPAHRLLLERRGRRRSRRRSRSRPFRSAGRKRSTARSNSSCATPSSRRSPRSRTSRGSRRCPLPLHWSETGSRSACRRSALRPETRCCSSLAAQIEAARPWADRRPPVV